MTTCNDCTDTLDLFIQGIAQQNEQALESLYTETLSKVYGLAIKITSRKDLAEEVVADTYWQVWLEAARYDVAKGSVLAWIMVICRSRALDILRRNKGQHLNEVELDEQHEWESGEQTPIDLLLEVERANQLHGALALLTPLERQLIALSFFKGLSHGELATQLQLPLGSVKTTIRRAQSVLRSKLG